MTRPIMQRSSVVFPAPFFPSSPTTEPAGISRSIPSSTFFPSKVFTTPRASITLFSCMAQLLQHGFENSQDLFARQRQPPRRRDQFPRRRLKQFHLAHFPVERFHPQPAPANIF